MCWWTKRWSWIAAVALVCLGRSAEAAEVEVEQTQECGAKFEHHVGWTALPSNAEEVALGAVLALPVVLDLSGPQAEAATAYLTVEVTASDGSPVAGAVESLDRAGQYVAWRPDEALSAESTYGVRLFADNEAMRRSDDARFSGEANDIETLWSFTVSDESPTVIEWDAVEVVAEYLVVETIAGASGLVCCDETYPLFDIKVGCTSLRGGTCGSRNARGEARGFLELASHPEVVASNTALELGTWSDASGSACATVTRTNRTDGSQDEREFCLELEGPLGELPDYDVEARLAEVCEGVPYTCVRVLSGDWGFSWDPDDCMTAAGEGSDDAGGDDGPDADADSDGTPNPEPGTGGCGCSSTSAPPPFAVLGLLLLMGLRRRRQPAGISSLH